MYSEDEPPSGLVTDMQVQKKIPERVSVFVEGEFAFGLHRDVVRQFGLERGSHVSASTALAALRADSAHRAFGVALNLLSYRARTEFEIRQRLDRKGFHQEVVDEAVRRLLEHAYVDDRSFAREYAGARVASKGDGLFRIRANLLRRGIPGAIVDQVISELQPGVDWLEVAREQGRKRWDRLGETEDSRRRKKKLLDYLVRKGFEYSIARRVAAELEEQQTA